MSGGITPTFQGEVQLAGWSESHNSGCKVTFWLADPSDLDAFRAMTVKKGNQSGQRLACVLVEIGEDEKPVAPEPIVDGLGPLCLLAVKWCRDPQFQKWAVEEFPFINPAGYRDDEEFCKAVVCSVCSIESRKQLDISKAAADLFHKHIREPYRAFLGG